MTQPLVLGRKATTLLTRRQTVQRIPSEGTCGHTGKVRYRSKKLAAQAMAILVRTNTWGGPDAGVYRCSWCRSWHMTSHPWPEGADGRRPA